MLNKNIPTPVIQIWSHQHSQRFYVQYVELPPPADTKVTDCDSISTARSGIHQDQVQPSSTTEAPTNKQTNSNHSSDLTQKDLSILSVLATRTPPVMTEQQVRLATGICSGSTLHRSKNRLVIRGHVTIHRVQRGKNYLSVWVLEDKAFGTLGLCRPRQRTIGGPLHDFLQIVGGDFYRAMGYGTDFESQLDNGKLVDVLATLGNEKVCIEIGLPPLNKEVENCARIFASSLDPSKVVHAVKNSKDKKQLEELIAHDSRLVPYRDKIEVTLAGSYVK